MLCKVLRTVLGRCVCQGHLKGSLRLRRGLSKVPTRQEHAFLRVPPPWCARYTLRDHPPSWNSLRWGRSNLVVGPTGWPKIGLPEAYRAIGGVARDSIAYRAIVGHEVVRPQVNLKFTFVLPQCYLFEPLFYLILTPTLAAVWSRGSETTVCKPLVLKTYMFLPALLQKLVGEFFFDFSQGNLENLVGNLEGIFRGFFLTHRTKAQQFWGKLRSVFRKKFVARKKSFVLNSLCRRATLTYVCNRLRAPF